MEIHFVVKRDRNSGIRHIFAFSTEQLAKDFITKNKAKHKKRYGWIDGWVWAYRTVELDKEVTNA